METKNKSITGLFIWAVLFLMPAVFLQDSIAQVDDGSTEVFVYSVDGRRDPFISLLDKRGDVKQTVPDKEQELINAVAGIKVGGIIWDKDMPLAMINNEIRKIGDTVNGLEVKAITPESVTFGYYDLTHAITIIEKKEF